MKKVVIIISSIILFFFLFLGLLQLVDFYYSQKINSKYNSQVGNQLLVEKNKGLVLQEKGLERGDNLFIFGSSELNTEYIPSHPSNIFVKYNEGFQVNLIGRGNSQSIIHAINFAAIPELQNKKVVVILSPQWFTKSGLTSENFLINFSELQFYSVMFNDHIKQTTKMQLANRVSTLLQNTKNHNDVNRYLSLYLRNDFLSKAELNFLKPYYYVKYDLLKIKDKKEAWDSIKNQKQHGIEKTNAPINWNKELIAAENNGGKETNNNQFHIMNSYFDTYIKEKLPQLKNANRSNSYTQSPEYDDLKLLLEISKEQDIKPLFISVPVHGKWYDYTGFPRNDRREYYNKVNQLINSYGFEVADFSRYEYEDYFLKDVMHLGWKGWVHVDQEIDRYYHQD